MLFRSLGDLYRFEKDLISIEKWRSFLTIPLVLFDPEDKRSSVVSKNSQALTPNPNVSMHQSFRASPNMMAS